MTLRVDPSLPSPPSRQLVEGVLEQIAARLLGPGDKLPSVRGLAAEALVNPNTVGKAYRELEAMGAVAGRNGAGVFVTDAGPAIARDDRRRATMRALQLAVAAAMRVGHDPARVKARVEQWLGNTQPNGVCAAPRNGKTGTSNGAR